MGKEDVEEGFITWDLLLLPGGGKPLQRATAMHTYVGCVYPIRAVRNAHYEHTRTYIHTCIRTWITHVAARTSALQR